MKLRTNFQRKNINTGKVVDGRYDLLNISLSEWRVISKALISEGLIVKIPEDTPDLLK